MTVRSQTVMSMRMTLGIEGEEYTVVPVGSDRLRRLQREVEITDDERQPHELRDRPLEANIKKGWKRMP